MTIHFARKSLLVVGAVLLFIRCSFGAVPLGAGVLPELPCRLQTPRFYTSFRR